MFRSYVSKYVYYFSGTSVIKIILKVRLLF